MTPSQSPLFLCMHYIAVAGALLASVFVVNNFFTYIFDMPGLFGTFASIGIPIGDASGDYSAGKLAFGWLQTLSFAVAFIYPVILLRNLDISRDAKFLDGGASFIVAGAFWSVMLIGIVPWYFLSDLKFMADMGMLLVTIMLINMVLSLVVLPTLVWFIRPKFLAREDLIVGENVDIQQFLHAQGTTS